MELEKLQLQNQCLLLEVREKEEKLRLQQEKHQRQDAVRIQMMEGGKSVRKYRAEKWPSDELTPQLTLEELTKNRSDNYTQAKTGDMASQNKLKKIAAQRDK